jgi:hypothetical protein
VVDLSLDEPCLVGSTHPQEEPCTDRILRGMKVW